jgi:hypothetical protein
MRRARWILAVLATASSAAWSPAGAAAQPSPVATARSSPVTVASGATKVARWELVTRSPRPGRRCAGLRVQQIWNESVSARRGRCGPARIGRRAVTLQTLAPAGLGSFAFGRAGRGVDQVEVRVGERAPVTVATLLGPGGRFWVLHTGDACAAVTVRAIAPRAGKPRSGRIGPRGCR